jgi:hypothetical protein
MAALVVTALKLLLSDFGAEKLVHLECDHMDPIATGALMLALLRLTEMAEQNFFTMSTKRRLVSDQDHRS